MTPIPVQANVGAFQPDMLKPSTLIYQKARLRSGSLCCSWCLGPLVKVQLCRAPAGALSLMWHTIRCKVLVLHTRERQLVTTAAAHVPIVVTAVPSSLVVMMPRTALAHVLRDILIIIITSCEPTHMSQQSSPPPKCLSPKHSAHTHTCPPECFYERSSPALAESGLPCWYMGGGGAGGNMQWKWGRGVECLPADEPAACTGSTAACRVCPRCLDS